jgi:tetratricopeptide (TPR) repeat protein
MICQGLLMLSLRTTAQATALRRILLIIGFALIIATDSAAQNRDLDRAAALTEAALQLNGQGRSGEAIPLAKEALAIRETALGPDHAAVAQSLNTLALVYRNQGRYAEAETLYRRSLAIYEQVLGGEHPGDRPPTSAGRSLRFRKWPSSSKTSVIGYPPRRQGEALNVTRAPAVLE